jgi:WD40 repeat protein
VAWSPGDHHIYSAGDDGIVWAWHPETGEPSRPIEGHKGPVKGLAVSSDGRYLLTGGEDETVRCWDLKDRGRELWKKATHASGVFCVAISSDGQWGISSGQDRTIRRWRLADGREVKSYETEVSYYSVSLTPDGRHALAAGDSPVVISLDLETGRATPRCTHRDVVWSVVCSAKSDWAVSGGGDSARSQDYLARVWNAADGRPRCTLKGHRGAVGAVAISPDGRRVLSGSADHTVRLWDARSGQELQVFAEHQGHVSGIGFSPDGNRAVSVGLDGSAFVWPLADAPD